MGTRGWPALLAPSGFEAYISDTADFQGELRHLVLVALRAHELDRRS